MKLHKVKKQFVKCLALVLCLILPISLTACGGAESSQPTTTTNTEPQKTITIKLGLTYGAETYEAKAFYQMKEMLESKSDHIKMEVYPSGQIGDSQALCDSIRANTIEMIALGTEFAQYSPYLYTIEMPYLYANWDEARTILANDEFREMTTGDLINHNVTFLGYVPIGWRTISSKKQLTTYNDLQGLRIRIPNIQNYVQLFGAWGCNAVPLALSETFVGLEQGVVEGQDNPMNVIIANRWYEVQPYDLITRHMMTVHMLFASTKFMESLSAEDRALVEECAAQALEKNWELVLQGEKDEIEFLTQNGVTVTEISPGMYQQMKDVFMEKVAPWYFKNVAGSKEVYALVDKIKSEM